MTTEEMEEVSRKIALNLYDILFRFMNNELEKIKDLKLHEFSIITVSSLSLISMGTMNLIAATYREHEIDTSIEEIYVLYKKILDAKFEDYLKFKGEKTGH